MVEWNIEIGIVAEPYFVHRDRDDWASDTQDSVVIILRRIGTKGPPTLFTVVERGPGFVVVGWGGWKIIGTYFSPIKGLDMFERFLNRIEDIIRRLLPGKVAGDLNVKSVLWGSPTTDARGELLTEWATNLNLICLNKGVAQTCVRQRGGGSIVDFTFATPEASRLLEDWWVEENVETLSDHKYVRMDWSALTPGSQMSIRNVSSITQKAPR